MEQIRNHKINNAVKNPSEVINLDEEPPNNHNKNFIPNNYSEGKRKFNGINNNNNNKKDINLSKEFSLTYQDYNNETIDYNKLKL